jgi:hypothetical protein
MAQNCNIKTMNVNILAKAATFIEDNDFIKIELWKKQSVRALLGVILCDCTWDKPSKSPQLLR